MNKLISEILKYSDKVKDKISFIDKEDNNYHIVIDNGVVSRKKLEDVGKDVICLNYFNLAIYDDNKIKTLSIKSSLEEETPVCVSSSSLKINDITPLKKVKNNQLYKVFKEMDKVNPKGYFKAILEKANSKLDEDYKRGKAVPYNMIITIDNLLKNRGLKNKDVDLAINYYKLALESRRTNNINFAEYVIDMYGMTGYKSIVELSDEDIINRTHYICKILENENLQQPVNNLNILNVSRLLEIDDYCLRLVWKITKTKDNFIVDSLQSGLYKENVSKLANTLYNDFIKILLFEHKDFVTKEKRKLFIYKLSKLTIGTLNELLLSMSQTINEFTAAGYSISRYSEVLFIDKVDFLSLFFKVMYSHLMFIDQDMKIELIDDVLISAYNVGVISLYVSQTKYGYINYKIEDEKLDKIANLMYISKGRKLFSFTDVFKFKDIDNVIDILNKGGNSNENISR